MSGILQQLGLTPETIRRHVVAVAPTKPRNYRGRMRSGLGHKIRRIEKRAAFIKAGLTVLGQARVNIIHPQLHGLAGKDYHREYMRIWRAGKL